MTKIYIGEIKPGLQIIDGCKAVYVKEQGTEQLYRLNGTLPIDLIPLAIAGWMSEGFIEVKEDREATHWFAINSQCKPNLI